MASNLLAPDRSTLGDLGSAVEKPQHLFANGALEPSHVPGTYAGRFAACLLRAKYFNSRRNRPTSNSLSTLSRWNYCNSAHSALAFLRMGMSGSGSFQRVKKS